MDLATVFNDKLFNLMTSSALSQSPTNNKIAFFPLIPGFPQVR
jgi:hypothetical protein